MLLVRTRSRSAQMEFAELKGRLSAMAELAAQQSSDQVRGLNERIDTLARHLSQTLDNNAARLGDNLSEAGRRTSESLSTLNERLALIDEARRSLSELSSEVGSLHGVLANKQARGAFGQMRMETIVRDALPAGAYDFQPTLSNGKRPDCVIRLPGGACRARHRFQIPARGLRGAARGAVARGHQGRQRRDPRVGRAPRRGHRREVSHSRRDAGDGADVRAVGIDMRRSVREVPDLVQGAHRARVMIVAPNTLMLAVQTVLALLKDAKMRDHADIIQREVTLLLGDVAQLVERVGDLERHFALSGKSLEKVSASTGKILGRRQRLTSLDLEAMEGSPGNVTALPDAEASPEAKRGRGR